MNQRYTILAICLSVCTLLSCQKEVDQNLDRNSTTNATNRIKGIILRDTAQQWIENFSFQYDSSNNRMNIYDDDPASSNNSLDSLKYVYQFDQQGYLVAFRAANNNQLATQYSISRNASNVITGITDYSFSASNPREIYYSFSPLSGGGQQLVDSAIMNGTSQVWIVDFNSNNQEIRTRERGSTVVIDDRLYYDNQGRISRITTPRDSLDFAYGTATPPAGWTELRRQIMGRDGELIFRQLSGRVGTVLEVGLPNHHYNRDFKFFNPPATSIRQRGVGVWPSTIFYNETVNIQYLLDNDQRYRQIQVNGPTGTVFYDFFY
jgi:YD repeat-containing protein